MKFYTIDEILDYANNGNYKYAYLEDQDENIVVTQGKPGDDNYKNKLEEIEARLTSKGLPDGVYNVCLKINQYSKTIPDKFAFVKGNPSLEEKERSTKVIVREKEEPVRSYQDAINDKVTVSELKLKVESLEKENAELKEDIKVLEEEVNRLEEELEEKEEESLQDSDQNSLVNSFTSIIVPFAEEYLNVRKSELALKYKELESQALPQNSQAAAPPAPGKKTVKAPVITGENFERFLVAVENNEPEFNRRLLYIEKTNPKLFPIVEAWVLANYEVDGEEEEEAEEDVNINSEENE